MMLYTIQFSGYNIELVQGEKTTAITTATYVFKSPDEG